jgi:hypothetical protein
MTEQELTAERKALRVNLDSSKYGTFAEIGAGQEVARHFFQAGGAAGTVAKTISAYDMKFSDAIYGEAGRYVSRKRLVQMMAHEYGLLDERLSEARGQQSTFFAFSNTVSALNYSKTNECHGWMGIRFKSLLYHPTTILFFMCACWIRTTNYNKKLLEYWGSI